MKQFILILLSVTLCMNTEAQKGNNLLKDYEIELLSILTKDTVNNTSFVIPSNNFNFGVDQALFTNIQVLKNKKNIYLQPLGTGRLYEVKKMGTQIRVDRIDNTIHSGVNFFAQNFFVNDTLYQFGGLGFWQIRGIITQYSLETKQWELVQANRIVPSFFDNYRDAVLHFENTNGRPGFYVSNSYYYKDYPHTSEIVETDSIYHYDFYNRQWGTLGVLDPSLKKKLANKGSREIEMHLDNFFISQSQLDFFWIDFRNNRYGNLLPQANAQLRQIWLGLYQDEKKTRNQIVFQFYLGDHIYFIKKDQDQALEWKKIVFDLKALDLNHTSKVYTYESNYIKDALDIYHQYKLVMLLFFIVIIILIPIILYYTSSKKIPNEVTAILNDNFFTALSVIEKELVEVLYQYYLKNEELPARIINKIIGVQQKDVLTQNKSRSDYFIRINQKYKLATRQGDPLIVKNRDVNDKRQYNYSLNKKYIVEIEKLLKN